jgi:hypothetical protein
LCFSPSKFRFLILNFSRFFLFDLTFQLISHLRLVIKISLLLITVHIFLAFLLILQLIRIWHYSYYCRTFTLFCFILLKDFQNVELCVLKELSLFQRHFLSLISLFGLVKVLLLIRKLWILIFHYFLGIQIFLFAFHFLVLILFYRIILEVL